MFCTDRQQVDKEQGAGRKITRAFEHFHKATGEIDLLLCSSKSRSSQSALPWICHCHLLCADLDILTTSRSLPRNRILTL